MALPWDISPCRANPLPDLLLASLRNESMSPIHRIAFYVFDTRVGECPMEHDGPDHKDVTDHYRDQDSQGMGPRTDSNPISCFAVTL